MIDGAYVQRMARYNRWQNQNLFGVANALSDDERRRERGAFFGSIHRTLSHLLWADHMQMSRLTDDVPPPAAGIRESPSVYSDWRVLCDERAKFDDVMLTWAQAIEPSWLDADFTYYSRSLKSELTRPRRLIVTHMFNHQTHHRGQVHCMLTQAGGSPADTDLPFMPE